MRDDQAVTIPLTLSQKGRLLLDCLPLIFFVALAIFFFTLLRDLIASKTPLFVLFFAAIFLVLGYQTLQRLRDLFSGVALVEQDVLKSSHHASGRASNRGARPFYGQFTRLGKLRLIGNLGYRSDVGRTYRVIYSPVSKWVWELEPAE